MRPSFDLNSRDSKLSASFSHSPVGSETELFLFVGTKQLKKDRVLRCLSSNNCCLKWAFGEQASELSCVGPMFSAVTYQSPSKISQETP